MLMTIPETGDLAPTTAAVEVGTDAAVLWLFFDEGSLDLSGELSDVVSSAWTCLACLRMAMISPRIVIPMSRK